MGLAVCQLGRIARELLAERQRRRVLQMGAADLDDLGKGLGLFGQCRLQLRRRRQQALHQRLHRGHMHGRGKHIVARLAHVHVVVGVHQARIAALAAQQFAGAVGQHLVDVHIGLGARAGLPDHQRELLLVAAGDHFVGGLHDGPGLGGVEQAQLLVDNRRGALDLGQRVDQLARLALARNIEVLQRALRLRAPQSIGRHRDGAESVTFLSACLMRHQKSPHR
ncbi:hypothetical protein D3C78_1139960 [compost metagenome]